MSERMTEAEIADLNVRRINRDGRAEVLCTKAFYEIAALRAEIERLTRKARFNDISVLPEKDAEYAALRAENEKLRAALREIASGKYSGIVLTSYPPQDPAVNRARAALEGKP